MSENPNRLDGRFWLEGTPYLAEENVGAGAYGVVCKAIDTRCNKPVAIKKIPRAFTSYTLTKRSLREVRILRELLHENIIAVLDMFTAEGVQGRDIYLVMDLMETDLHQILHSRQSLVESHFQYFLYQLLRGLKYLHSAGIIHRDLKPSNLLLNGDCLLRIADFGMARSCAPTSTVRDDSSISGHMTQYVSTRWYRAPEILFSMIEYDTKVDLWSAGCIFGEMLLRRQLFPGKDGISQIKYIVYLLGYPDDEVIRRISSSPIREAIESCGRKTPIPFSAIFPKASQEARELIANLLQISPWKRSSAAQILKHPYLARYHNEEYEPLCPPRVQFDMDAIEKYEGSQVVAGLDEEANIFEIRRGANYPTRKLPPPLENPEIFDIPDEEQVREDPTDYFGNAQPFESLVESGETTPTSISSISSAETVREVDIAQNRSISNDDDQEDTEKPGVSNAETFVEQVFRKGIHWPLNEASTSSAPPSLHRSSPNPPKISKNLLEKRHIDRIREEYGKMPKVRDKRANSDASTEDNQRKLLRKSRQELRKSSNDEDGRN